MTSFVDLEFGPSWFCHKEQGPLSCCNIQGHSLLWFWLFCWLKRDWLMPGLSNKPIFPQPLCLSKQPLSEEPEAHASGACLLPANGGEWRTAIGYWKTLGVAVNYFHSHSFNFSCSQTARRNHPPTLRLRLSRSRLVRHGRCCTFADLVHAVRSCFR